MSHPSKILASLLLVALSAIVPSVSHATDVSVSGAARQGPIAPDGNGRFVFPSVPLGRNAVNRFDVSATDAAGTTLTDSVEVTQISLDSIVVSQVTSRPLPPEEIEQLVADGTIDLEDPENYNVSVFAIVLTIDKEPVPISVPVARRKGEPLGFEVIKIPRGGSSGGRTPKVSDAVIFEYQPPATSGGLLPPPIPGVILIEGRIKSLKEFFGVRLLLMNVSGLFTLSDVTARISFPDGGLTSTLPMEGVARFGDILPGTAGAPGQAEREFIIRGDQIGVRPIVVEFGGTLTGPGIPVDEPIPFNGAGTTSVEVKGPPTFLVQVSHPDEVTAGVPYELVVDITNTGETPALYASLDLDVGAAADLAECTVDPITLAPDCEVIPGVVTRSFGRIDPSANVREVFTVLPTDSGRISSCTGASDQNITLQVHVGNLGCLVGTFPPALASPDGSPTVTVIPTPNLFGVGVDAPVVAFFSELMDEGTIGANSFRLFDGLGNPVGSRITFTTLSGRTAAILQVEDGVTNRLQGNTEYEVQLATGIRDLEGQKLANAWVSTFTTTDPVNDTTPPTLTLSLQPPVDPLHVQPGEVLTLNAYAQDQGSRVARVEVRLLDADDPNALHVFLDQKSVFDSSGRPCLFSIDTSSLVPGHAHQLLVRAFDNAGNFQNATLGFLLATVPIAPSVTLPPDPATPTPQGISLPVAPAQVGPTIQRVEYFVDAEPAPFATLFLRPHQTSVDTTHLTLGPHTLIAVAYDSAGASAQDTLVFAVVANAGAPTVSFAIADGAQYVQGLVVVIGASVLDPLGLTNVEYFLDGLAGPPIATNAQAFPLDTSTLSLGSHTITVRATNTLGNTNDTSDPSAIFQFSVVPLPTGVTPPAAPVITSVSLPRAGPGGLDVVQISGTASPGSRIDLTNLEQGLAAAVFADAAGTWSASIGADPGDTISAVAVDLAQSALPSAPATAVVAAPPVLLSLATTPDPFTLTAFGAVQPLTVTANFSDGSHQDVTGQATYGVVDPAVASVAPDGRVIALANGTTDVTVSYLGETTQVTVTVSVVTLTGLVVTPASLAFENLGESQQLVAQGQFSDGSTGPLAVPVAFFGSAPGVATVNASGLVTATGGGVATVFVSAGGLAAVAIPVTVTANDPAPTVQILAPAGGSGVEPGDLVGFQVRGDDVGGGVAQLVATATGEATFSETIQVQPPKAQAVATFEVPVPPTAAVGGQIQLSIRAVDHNGSSSTVASIVLDVIDDTRPQATITAPAAETAFNFGDSISLAITASDAVGVTEIRYDVTGAFSASGSYAVAPAQANASHTFAIPVPFGLTSPDVVLTAQAVDARGNVGSAIPVPVRVTDADITPPDTIVTAVGTPSGATVTVDYTVQAGLADLDHVQLYFRRNGHGTFNRYTDAPGGNPDGAFFPQSGADGSIVFDSTRMGGDGSFEFATVGVDSAGNREPMPEDGLGNPVADPGATVAIAAGTVFVVLDSDTQIAAAALDGQNVRVSGARVTLVGSHALANLELVNGAVLNHLPADAVSSHLVDLSVWTLTIDETSAIDVSGLGYLGGTDTDEPGQSAGNQPGSGSRNGGSHGGLGGSANGAVGLPAPVYGDLTEPLFPGGGGGANGTTDGGAGGGLVLLGAVNVVVDGAIRADGAIGASGLSGMGAGGGINLRTRTLSGGGTFEADGGTRAGANNVGGGGGRIAIRYLDLSTYDPQRITVAGGDGFYADGADGTIFLLLEGETAGDLIINGNGPGSPLTNLLIPPGATFDTIILQNGANVMVTAPIELARDLIVRGGSQLTHADADESCLVIDARHVDIDATSAIDVTARGYPGGVESDEPGLTLATQTGAGVRVGGSYGGQGGTDLATAAQSPVYGDPKRPALLGSGGGANGTTDGGAGGGCVRITTSAAVVVDGAIRANGGIGAAGQSGMGSGGSVWITTSRLAGAGVIQADGGDRAGSNNQGGGGGRIALDVDFVDPQSDLGGLRQVTARGGDGFYSDGAPGTVYVLRTGDVDGELVVDAGRASGTWPAVSRWVSVGPGATAALGADSLTTDGVVPLLPGGLAGLRLNPDTIQNETFEIADNTADGITVVTPNENGVAFSSVAVVGARYAGLWQFDRVVLRGGAFVEIADPVVAGDFLAVTERSWLAHPETTRSYEATLELSVDSLWVDDTSRIDVSARGYEGGRASNEPGSTLGNVAGSGIRAGGSYGGVGGRGDGGGDPNPTYGSLTDPRELGSGGGANGATDGGDGGGRVLIDAETLVVDGAIRADGGVATGGISGMGAGGSVNLIVGALDGTGTISADGGNRNGANNVGGGGGRVAIHHLQPIALPIAHITARGGDGFYGDGGPGTVFVRSASQLFGDLVIDARGAPSPEDLAILPGDLAFDDITLRGGARVLAQGPIQATGTLRLEESSSLTHAAGDERCLQIAAAAVEVETGSAIDVTGRGYPGGRADDEPGTTLLGQIGAPSRTGGSYGGPGGVASGAGGPASPVYGDPKRPVWLGSGGGANGGTDGGDGGGCIRIVTTTDVVVEGELRANGALGVNGLSGMGSGGSIWITTSRLAGSGAIHADGGDRGGANNVGGGGGRIALEVDEVDPFADFAGLRQVTARGGDGFYGDGAPGTVYAHLAGDIDGAILVDAGLPSGTWPVETRWVPIGPGVALSVGSDTLLTDGGVTLLPGGLAGLRLNPDTSQDETFVIGANTESVITVVTPNDNGVDFSAVASAGATYAGDWRFDRMTIRGGAFLEVADPVTIHDRIDLTEESWLTHPETTRTYEASLRVVTDTFAIETGSKIDVSARGYEGGRATDEPGFTLGNVQGSGSRSAGSYGGLGGEASGAGGPPNPVYGDPLDPRELGSGGGANGGTDGGDGGGRVLIDAVELILDGVIRANGGIAANGWSGMGSGGSVNLALETLGGSGIISADGGDRGGANNVGGGGGRVSVMNLLPRTLPDANITARGGDGLYGDGQDGSVSLQGP